MIFWKVYSVFYNQLNKLIPYQDHINAILKHTRINRDGLFLDAGCGTGNLIRNRSNVIGVDVSGPMLQIAKKSNPKSTFIQANLNERLPFDDQYFDGAYSNNVLAYVRNPKVTLRELYRILKPNATLTVATLRPSFSPLAILRQHIRKSSIFSVLKYVPIVTLLLTLNLVIVRRLANGVYHGFELHTLKELLNECGFEVIHEALSYADQDVLMVAVKR